MGWYQRRVHGGGKHSKEYGDYWNKNGGDPWKKHGDDYYKYDSSYWRKDGQLKTHGKHSKEYDNYWNNKGGNWNKDKNGNWNKNYALAEDASSDSGQSSDSSNYGAHHGNDKYDDKHR